MATKKSSKKLGRSKNIKKVVNLKKNPFPTAVE